MLDSEQPKINIVGNITPYTKPGRFSRLKKYNFLVVIPIFILDSVMLYMIYFKSQEDESGLARYVVFIHVPILIFLIIWTIYTLSLSHDDMKHTTSRRFENLFNQMIDGCAVHEIILDKNGTAIDYRFLDVNPAFEKLSHLKCEDVIGKKLSEVEEKAHPEWISAYAKVVATGEPTHFEVYYERIDKYFEVTAFATGYRQFAVIFADVTDKKVMDQRKTELEVERNKNILLSSVLSSLSHDFRTPISIINTSLYLIERLEDPIKRVEKIKQIKAQAELFERFIKDVISIINLEYATSTNKTSVDVNDILRDICYVFNHRMQRRSLRLNLNTDFNVPDIFANPTQLAQVFSSLLENAINFNNDGGLISISTFFKNNEVKIVFEDTGIGINSSELEKIYDKFYRVDKARSVKSGGLGLGLSIVKKIINLHGFKINVSSKLNEWTRFEIIIPESAIDKRISLNSKTNTIPAIRITPDKDYLSAHKALK